MATPAEHMDALLVRRDKRAATLARLRSTEEYKHFLELRSLEIPVDLDPPRTPVNWEFCPKRTWERRFSQYKLAIRAWSERYLQMSLRPSDSKADSWCMSGVM